jgi:hypothetical protein
MRAHNEMSRQKGLTESQSLLPFEVDPAVSLEHIWNCRKSGLDMTREAL